MKLAQLALLGMVVVAAALTVREMPELARYMKMRSM